MKSQGTMADCIKYDGDYLLKKFKELNINVGGLDPNVVRAWFDTDDQDIINFLNYVCSGLSKKNVVLSHEIAEFESIENHLQGIQLENAISKLEKEKPGILDYDLNAAQLGVYLSELELLKEEEQRLEDLLKIETMLQQNLSQNKLSVERESVKLDFTFKKALLKCDKLSKEVDEMNWNLHEKLSKDLIALANFDCDEYSEFFNRKNLNDIHNSEIQKTVECLLKNQQEELCGTFSISNINLYSTLNNDQNIKDKLEIAQNKIYSSYIKYIQAKMEEESLSKIYSFLENFSAKDFLELSNNSSPTDLLQQKEMLFSKVKQKAQLMTEEPITLIKINKLQTELKDAEYNLKCYSGISEYYSKLFFTNCCALMFLLHEKTVIGETDKGIRHVSKYILNNLEDINDRSKIMLNIIGTYREFIERPIEHRNEVLRIIVSIYGETMLKDAYWSCHQLKKNLEVLEQRHFIYNITEEIVNKLFKTNELKEFLICGPTSKSIIIPNPLLKSLKNVKSNLAKQNAALKFVLQISNQTLKKLNSDNWLKNFRLVWIYFLVAPKKLKELLCQMEENIKGKELKAVRFKE